MIILLFLFLAVTNVVPASHQAQAAKLLPGFSVNLPDYPVSDYYASH